ncbi:MAG: tripartite tricarboxylate transporter TctB family protein [Syntrophales bacterium]
MSRPRRRVFQREAEEETIKHLNDRIVSTVFLVLSCLVMIESVRLKLDDVREPGPGFVPFVFGLTLAVLSVIAFIFPDTQKKAAAFWNDWQKGRGIIAIFGGLIVYLLLVRVLGFYIDTFLLMAFLLKMSGEQGIKRPLLVALITVGITYLLFHRLLFIPFPAGFLGI